MKRCESNNFFRRFFGSPLFLVSALGVSFLFIFAFAKNYIEDYNIRREIAMLKQDVQALETKKIESLQILEYVMSDDFVEEKARTELNLKKPGENVMIVKNSEELREVEVGMVEDERIISKPLRWWYYFVDRDAFID